LIANYPVGLAHDARNVLAAMDIYCDLLCGPGVLNPQYRHLADELRLLRESSSSLMDRLLILAIKLGPADRPAQQPLAAAAADAGKSFTVAPSAFINEPSARKPVTSVAAELLVSHKMLSALAGPKVSVELAIEEAPEGELKIAAPDFTRVLINLVRNAAEAMGTGGQIVIAAKPAPADASPGPAALVSVEDNGPGIPLSLLERIFELNSDGAAGEERPKRRMTFRPRGLGLRIVRELVEGGGGVIRAARLPERGSRFEIVLPMVTKIGTP
jgi:signal transduction histidine kinase